MVFCAGRAQVVCHIQAKEPARFVYGISLSHSHWSLVRWVYQNHHSPATCHPLHPSASSTPHDLLNHSYSRYKNNPHCLFYLLSTVLISSIVTATKSKNTPPSLQLFAFILIMENVSTSFASTTTTMNNLSQPNTTGEPLGFPSTSATSSTTFRVDNPAQYGPSHESLQFPYTYPWDHAGQSSYVYPEYPFWLAQTGVEFGVSNSIPMPCHGVRGLCFPQEKGILHAQMSKIARSNRKMARQRSLSLSRNPSSGAYSDVPASTRWAVRRLTLYGASTDVQNTNTTTEKDLYTFCTPDDKKLRVLLTKVLKNSDVGSLGRIVLPKSEAEKNLPILSDKEGIPVMIRDAYSNQEWRMRYKYWSNNKSRMYVLENTGDFVKQIGLETGDSLTLYEDESKNLYFSIKKVEKPAAEPSLYNQNYTNHNYKQLYTPFANQARDEDAASLAILVEQLKQKEQHEANNSLVTFPMDGAASFRQCEEAEYGPSKNVTSEEQTVVATERLSSSSSISSGEMREVVEHKSNFDDFYSGLGTLPDVNRYNYPFFDFMSSDPHDVQGGGGVDIDG